MVRRSRLEIYLELLRAVRQTSRRTHIGNLTNLSWKDTKKHLEFLESKGFVKIVGGEGGSTEYKISEKGLEAMEAFERVTGTFSPELKASNPKTT